MKIKKALVFLFVFLMLIFVLNNTQIVIDEGIESLILCAFTIIPTLFPFFVISGIMVNTGIITALGKVLSPISKLLFKTSGKGAVVFIIGIVCGYPTGAKVIADMCKSKSLDKSEGERLLAFCNNSGPLFVIGAVGNAMLKNHALGVALYIIHAISAVLTGVLFRFFAKETNIRQDGKFYACSLAEAVSKSVESGVKSILNVCGYVVFFGIFSAVSDNLLMSLLEVTTGAKLLISSGLGNEIMLILLSGIMGFGGICVLMQVKSVVTSANLSVRPYFLGKVTQGVFSMALAKIYLSFVRGVPTFSAFSDNLYFRAPFDYIAICLFLIFVVLCFKGLTKKY